MSNVHLGYKIRKFEMICPNCKKEIIEESKFCEYCGLQVVHCIANGSKQFSFDFDDPEVKDEQFPTKEIKIEELLNKNKENQDDKKEKSVDKRIGKWKEKLIDLSKRNRLLNFKTTKLSTLRIIDEQPPEVFRNLVVNQGVMDFLPVITNDEVQCEEEKSIEDLNEEIEFKSQEFKTYNIDELNKKHIDKQLQTKLSKENLNKTLNKISTTAKSTNDDLGYNVLFLTLGSIVWYEDDNSDEKFESPVLLIPVEIKRKSIGEPYTIRYNEDSIILNPALTLKFKRDFGINFEEIEVNEDESDPIEIFSKVQEKIKNNKRWKLLNNIYIGLFSFAKFVMYKDIDTFQELIKKSELVKTICGIGEQKQLTTDSICPMSELDKKIKPELTFQILDADSSQQQAIQVVKENNNLVIEGPPGTGKSQTIANIIAELLSQGKKVLFVSQKVAALEVVKNRLDRNGLSPYCLELHSNKSNKKRVVEELNNTLEFNYCANYSQGNLLKLSKDISELTTYAKELHKPIGALNCKPYEAIGRVLKNSQIPDFEYIFKEYDKWDLEKLNYNISLFTEIKSIIQKLGEPQKHSFYGCELRDLDFETKIQLKDYLKININNISELTSNIKTLTEEILFKSLNKDSEIDLLIEVANVVNNIPDCAINKISTDNANVAQDIQHVCNCVKQFNKFNNRVRNKYNLGILNEDIENILQKFTIYKENFFSRISLDYYKDCNFIKKYFCNNYKPGLEQLIIDMNNIKELKTSVEKLEECDKTASTLYDKVWNRENPDEDLIKEKSRNLLKFQELISQNLFDGDIITKFKSSGINYEKIKQLLFNIKDLRAYTKEIFEKTAGLLEMDAQKAFNSDYSEINFNNMKLRFKNIIESCEDLTLWFKYLSSTDKIKQAHLTEFFNKCNEFKLPLEHYDKALETQFLRIWLNGYVFKNNSVLKMFNGLDQDNLLNEFKYLDKDQINSAKTRLLSLLCDNSLRAKEQYSKETTELKRQGKLQRMKKSLRQIIKSIPDLFLALKPCIMMSPTTVAQLLDPETFHFDVIIFDEASQLTTEDCIGSIIRGERLIVAGDTKQLPPTSFFKTVVDVEEDKDEDEESIEYEREDLDSILDECTTSGFPQCMLKWHYRSKHEYLIAFSNKHLYQDLYTFPCCIEDSETLGIKFFYNESSDTTKDNKRLEEAQIVAKAVMQHAKKLPNMSLGVATLNIKQKGLIEAELEKLREADPSCEDFFSDNNQEYFFIKNLESIQGDERDVIMISVGYFKNQNGILPMNFGPINRDGGERRLNVLITRARFMVEIFSGIKSSDFNLDKTNRRGVELLQKYLDFAERGEISLKQDTTAGYDDNFDSDFERAVCNTLRERGFSVKTQVGCSGYKIDLAIRDKSNPGHFLLGIECDGASYHSSPTARDRDRLRQEVLEQLGWKIYRIWSTDWFKNPEKQIEKLLNFIECIDTGKDMKTEMSLLLQ